MDRTENRRMFPRCLMEILSSLQINIWYACNKTESFKQSSKFAYDFSIGGLSFKSELIDDIMLPGTFLNRIEIHSLEGCILKTSGEVRHITYDNEDISDPPNHVQIADIEGYSYRIGVEFGTELTNDNDVLYKTSLTKQREKVIDSSLIYDNIKNIIENAIPVSLENLDLPIHPAIIGYITQIGVLNKFYIMIFKPAKQSMLSHSFDEFDRVQAMYQFNASGYKFTSIIISKAKDKLILKFPKSLNYLWQRSTLRYVPPRHNFIKLQILHPLFRGRVIERRVIDLTPTGLSIAMSYFQDMLIKNMFIPQMALIIPGERQIKASAWVKYISPAINEQLKNYFKCGLSFANLSAEDADFLVSYLLDKCYPHLKDARGEKLENIWNLFHETGFIYEDKRRFLAPISSEVNNTFKKLLESDTRFYKKIILKEGEKFYGTISGILAYEHTWLIQHLATLKHSHQFASREMVMAITDFCTKHQGVRYQKMFWRPDNHWAERVFGKYARQVANKADLSHLICYDYLIKSPLWNYQGVNLPSGEFIIKPLSEKERPLIESYFIARKDFVTLQADSLMRDEIDLPHIRQIYQQKGLMRDRQIYIAKSNHTFLGFVIIEDASLGTNLSGLLNYFRVYTTSECKEMEADVKRGLIHQAVTYYKNRNRHFAICLAANEDISVYETMGFKKKKEYMCWTVSQKLAQPYFNYLNELFTRIERRIMRKQNNTGFYKIQANE